MKTTIILGFASTAAAAVVSVHAPGQENPGTKKLEPWIPDQGNIYCFVVIAATNEDCGTKPYCKAFDKGHYNLRGNYESAAQCFAAHEPNPSPNATPDKDLEAQEPQQPKKKLEPWIFPGTGSTTCLAGGPSNQKCGTSMYCTLFDVKDDVLKQLLTEDYQSAEQCFKAHEPEPKL